MLKSLLRSAKNMILPKGPRFVRVPFGPVAGCVVNLDFQHHLTVYAGLYEYELNRHFAGLLKPSFRSFDVGGNSGYDALLMARRTRGRVVSFECDPEMVTLMRETFRRNPDYQIEIVQAFIGSKPDQLSLDKAVESSFVPDFVKMDIEGAEVDALRGAENLLKTRKPSMIIETHSAVLEAECLEILRGHAYEPQIVDQRKWLREYRPLAHNRWLVCAGR